MFEEVQFDSFTEVFFTYCDVPDLGVFNSVEKHSKAL